MPRGVEPLGPEAHRAEKIDPAEKLVMQMGGDIERAIDVLNERIKQNPDDAEALRELTLIWGRTADILKRAEELRKQTVH